MILLVIKWCIVRFSSVLRRIFSIIPCARRRVTASVFAVFALPSSFARDEPRDLSFAGLPMRTTLIPFKPCWGKTVDSSNANPLYGRFELRRRCTAPGRNSWYSQHWASLPKVMSKRRGVTITPNGTFSPYVPDAVPAIVSATDPAEPQTSTLPDLYVVTTKTSTAIKKKKNDKKENDWWQTWKHSIPHLQR